MVACLEVAISAGAKEALVANVISEAADLLSRLDVRACSALVMAPLTSSQANSSCRNPGILPVHAEAFRTWVLIPRLALRSCC